MQKKCYIPPYSSPLIWTFEFFLLYLVGLSANSHYISMAKCKAVVSPFLMHWRYHSLGQNHRCSFLCHWVINLILTWWYSLSGPEQQVGAHHSWCWGTDECSTLPRGLPQCWWAQPCCKHPTARSHPSRSGLRDKTRVLLHRVTATQVWIEKGGIYT